MSSNDICECCKSKCCCCEPVPPTPEPPVPPTPPKPEPEDKGRIKDWGSEDDNPHNWKVVSMKDDPTKFKVIDKDGVNIADLFNTEAGAKAFIQNAIDNYDDGGDGGEPEPEPPTPQPTGENVTKDGVQLPYNITGNIEYEFHHNDRDDGKRIDFEKLKPNTFVDSIVLGYFAFPNGKAPNDEVSGKWSVETHSDGTDPECYDGGVKIKNGESRWRFESPHPEYHDLTEDYIVKGIPLDRKFVGYMFIRQTLPDGNVRLEIWQDGGDNEGNKPANKWVKLISYVDKKYKVTKYPNGPEITIRVDGSNVVDDMEYKWVACVELKPLSK